MKTYGNKESEAAMMSSSVMKWEAPLLMEVDVAIIGGGTAGAVAGISCAREGASTLVVERYGSLGGTASMGQVVPLMPLFLPGNLDPSGISRDIKQEMLRQGWVAKDDEGRDGWFNPVMLPFVLDNLLDKAGGIVLHDAVLVDVWVESDEVREVLVQTRGGLGRIRAACFIDATGDAQLAHLAGVPCSEGDEKDGRNQSISLRFTMGGIDLPRFRDALRELGQHWSLGLPLLETASLWDQRDRFPLEALFRKGLEAGLITWEDGRYFQAFTIPGMPGAMAFNCPEIPAMRQALSPFSVSEAYRTGREMTLRLMRFLQQMAPGFEGAYLQSTGPMMGIRESRRIHGEVTLTLDDCLGCRKWEDAIAQSAYPVDIHSEEVDPDHLRPIPKGEWYEVPYQVMLPLGVERLLVTGRCLAASFGAQSAIRIQPVCRATGEAAGLAAAWAVRHESPTALRDIRGAELRAAMLARGGQFLAH